VDALRNNTLNNRKLILEGIRKRSRALFAHLPGDRLPDAILVFNNKLIDNNFFYLTGLSGGVFDNCGVIVDTEGKITLLTTALEEEAARALGNHAEILVYRNEKEKNSVLASALSKYTRLGINYGAVSHTFYLFIQEIAEQVETVDVGIAFRDTRMIKTEDEIKKIEKGCMIISEVAERIPSVLAEGMKELDLSAEIDYMMKKKGAHGPAFRTIAAFSKNTSMPHYPGGSVQLKNGDVVLVDFGAHVEGYASDITRTYLTGNPERELLDLYGAVLRAQQLALHMIMEGELSDHVDREVRACIDSHDLYKGRFIHSLGHSIGLDVHDDSYPSASFHKRFAENMVLTVEPGIYLPGRYGVRIEDDIVVEKQGCRVLTFANKEPVIYEI
jgi:Xaa-Pro dipeptidase